MPSRPSSPTSPSTQCTSTPSSTARCLALASALSTNSTAVTSQPRAARCTASRPDPQPMSSARPGSIASGPSNSGRHSSATFRPSHGANPSRYIKRYGITVPLLAVSNLQRDCLRPRAPGGTPAFALWRERSEHPTQCSAAFRAQLTQPAPVVRLHPFLRESSLLVVSEDVHELEHDPTAIRGKVADR